jgi:hypothetical protein
VSYIGGRPAGCGCFFEAEIIPADLKPVEPEMPLIDSKKLDEYTTEFIAKSQRDADMAWLPIHDQQVRQEFAEIVNRKLAGLKFLGFTGNFVGSFNEVIDEVMAAINAMAEEKWMKTFKQQVEQELCYLVCSRVGQDVKDCIDRKQNKTCRLVQESTNNILTAHNAELDTWKEKHFNDCMAAKKSGYEEGKSEEKRKFNEKLDRIAEGKNE